MEKTERSVYTPQDFREWQSAQTLVLTPKFQRRAVWSAGARSFFIDTLLRYMPVPPIYVRLVQEPGATRTVREIIDGQQRISCVLDFIEGKFRLGKSPPSEWEGKSFPELTQGLQARVLGFSFSTEVFRGISDLEVLEVFARLNTYSVPLNAQELRNGRYFGAFKTSAYHLGYEHLEFWRRHQIFSERSFARMLEVELTSELLIAQIAGMQDKKKSIDEFYARFDEEFTNQKMLERRFRDVIDEISEACGPFLKDSEFSRPPLFYTLFCAIYHRVYALPNFNVFTPKKALSNDRRLALAGAVRHLSDVIAAGRAGDAVPGGLEGFVAACLRQTDNIKPRTERLRILFRRAFKE